MGRPSDAATTPVSYDGDDCSEAVSTVALSPAQALDEHVAAAEPVTGPSVAAPNQRNRQRTRAPYINHRRSSMTTRGQNTKCLSSSSVIVVVGPSGAPNPPNWVGDLPLLPPARRSEHSERQLEVARPLGVERDEFQEAHLQQALGRASAAPTEIPCPTGATHLCDQDYLRLYPRTLKDRGDDRLIRTKGFRNRVDQHYCMDEQDVEWLTAHNQAHPQRAASQPATSSSSSATAVEDGDAMEVDAVHYDDSIRRVKTEPPPDTIAMPMPLPTPHQRRATLTGDSPVIPMPPREPVAGPSRLPSLAPSAVSTVLQSIDHTDDEYGCMKEDELEFGMEYLENVALAETKTLSPTMNVLQECMERDFPRRCCEHIINWRSWNPKPRHGGGLEQDKIPCICHLLSALYPHWLSRRAQRGGRSVIPLLEIPVEVVEDGEDPYFVFRKWDREWKVPNLQPQRSRNPRRDAEKAARMQKEAELLKHLPKFIKLTVKPPPKLPTPPPQEGPPASSPTMASSLPPSDDIKPTGDHSAPSPVATTPAPTTKSSTPVYSLTPARSSTPPSDVAPLSITADTPNTHSLVVKALMLYPPAPSIKSVKRGAGGASQRGRPKKQSTATSSTPPPLPNYLHHPGVPPGIAIALPNGYAYPGGPLGMQSALPPVPASLVYHPQSMHPTTPNLAAPGPTTPYGGLSSSVPGQNVFRLGHMAPLNPLPALQPQRASSQVTSRPVERAIMPRGYRGSSGPPEFSMSHPPPLPYPSGLVIGPGGLPANVDTQRTPVGTPPMPKAGFFAFPTASRPIPNGADKVTIIKSHSMSPPPLPTPRTDSVVVEADMLHAPMSPLTEPETSTEPEDELLVAGTAVPAMVPVPTPVPVAVAVSIPVPQPLVDGGDETEHEQPPMKKRKVVLPPRRSSPHTTRSRLAASRLAFEPDA